LRSNTHFLQANVVIDADGRPLLTDFGLSSIMAGANSIVAMSSGKGRGTVRWMAPELSDPNPAGAEIAASTEADIYAFAMVAIEVFTGGFGSHSDLCPC
jgi:serine/threonine protein kinase